MSLELKWCTQTLVATLMEHLYDACVGALMWDTSGNIFWTLIWDYYGTFTAHCSGTCCETLKATVRDAVKTLVRQFWRICVGRHFL